MIKNSKQNVLRQTQSICPICNRVVQAQILERQDKTVFSKSCPKHGRTEVPLSSSLFYKKLEQFYFPIREQSCEPVARVELVVTFKCNMECPVCYLGDFKKKLRDFEPILADIENFIRQSEYKMFVISGGEPTFREDLVGIIEILKKYHKTSVINTNGLKLANLDYAKKLKAAGLDRVNLQFGGFDSEAEQYLRGKDYIFTKLQALENLKKLGFSVGLNALIAGDLNEAQVVKLINYAVDNQSIRMLNFNTMIFVGYTRDYPKQRYLMPDDILIILERQTGGKIKRDNVYRFKKLEIVLSSFFKRDICFYHQAYLIVRKRGAYQTIDQYLNLEKLEPYLDKYQNIAQTNRRLAKIYLILFGPLILALHSNFLMILKDFFPVTLSYFFNRRYFLKSRKFIYLLFSVECDPLRIDYTINKSCPCKSIFFFDKVDGRFVRKKKPIESTYWLLWGGNNEGKQ